MNWLSNLLQFLQALEVALPPPSGHHSLTLGEFGNEADGPCENLILGVREEGGVRQLVLWAPDFEKPQEQLIDEIKTLMKEPADA